MSRACLPSIVLLSVFTAGSLRAQCTYEEEARLNASDPQNALRLGQSCAVSGATAVGGTLEDRVYTYRMGAFGWSFEQRLQASDEVANTEVAFGAAVGIDGSVLVVGAPDDDTRATNAGAVYVFRRVAGVWVEQQKLVAADGAAGDAFGSAVAVLGDVILIGAPEDDDRGAGSGSIYVFRKIGAGFLETQHVLASDGGAGDRFGHAVAMDGDAALIGAPGAAGMALSSGAAYVFRNAGNIFLQQQKLMAADGASQDAYGSSVAIDAATVLVGAHDDDDVGASTGAAYVHRFGGLQWTQEQKLLAAPPSAGAEFGRSVGLEGNLAVVGAVLEDFGHGACHVFRRVAGTWQDRGRLLQSDSAVGDEFGAAAAMDGNAVIVGSRSANQGFLTGAGALYAFTVDTLALGLAPSVVQVGDNVQFRFCGGIPAGLVGLILSGVNGLPAFQLLVVLPFDANGEAQLFGSLQSGPSGAVIEFRAISFLPQGLAASNPVTLTLK